MVLNYILLKNIVWKKLFIIKLYLQFLCVAGYLKHSNDTPKHNIPKYTNHNIIEICINWLSITTQIFITMDTRQWCQRSNFILEKDKNISQRHFFSPRRSNWIHHLWKYLSNYVVLRFLKVMYKNWKKVE